MNAEAWQRALRYRFPAIVAFHLLLVAATNYAAFWLRFDGAIRDQEYKLWQNTVLVLVVVRGLTFLGFKLFEGLWRYTSVWDLRNILAAVTASSVVFAGAVSFLLQLANYPRSVYIIDALLLVVAMTGVRMARRFYGEFSGTAGERRVLIVGAGDAGELIVRDMKASARQTYLPIGFVDDDARKKGRRIHGVRVLGTRHDLPKILERSKPHEVLIAIPGATPEHLRAIVRSLEPFKIPIKTLPRLSDIIDGKVEVQQIRNLAVEDLLARPAVGLDPAPVKRLIAGRRVMVTGAGGSIGSELCRQIASLRPASLVMFERYENSLHAIRLELEDKDLKRVTAAPGAAAGGASARHGFGLHPVIGDVTDAARVDAVMQQYAPEIVFHAAAHKHVPLMEENPCEAIKNNVRGTRILVEAAEAHGIDRFIFVSTDKAVNPTSVMGASKRVAELVVQAQGVGSGTSFSIVRFGNVLGSNGSVVPRFMEQIKSGGPVTITHPEMRRFFMLIPEAVQLVLHAASQAESGATYVLEMGEQVKLLDMARDLIRLSGLVPEEDVKIEFIGLRPGEKLYEELVGADEEASPSGMEKILCVRSRRPPSPELSSRVMALEAAALLHRRDEVLSAMQQLIGPFKDSGEATPVEEPLPAADAAATSSAGAPGYDEQPCPKCQSGRAHRSRARSLTERIRKEISDERLYRCEDCGWRGWLLPLEFGDPASVVPVSAPDLALLDAGAASAAPLVRQRFSPRSLQ
jgi:FlaA1/EpsC-like NDP-sugar epimerase